MTRRTVGIALLAVWLPLTTLVIAAVMVDHIAPLPPLGDLEVLRQGLDERLGPAKARVIHVIASGCSCTRGLVRHLARRGAHPDRSETVLFVGPAPPGGFALAERGYDIGGIERADLRGRLAIEGAPVLVVQDAEGQVAYAGGYFDSPAAVHARDERILAAVDRGEPPSGLPLFGCAVAPGLVEQRDPTGLRRRLDELDAWLSSWVASGPS